MSKTRVLLRLSGKFLAKLFAESYYLTNLCRLTVQIHDNDLNANFNENGELFLLQHMANISNSNSVFIDVGANKGDYSVELIKAGITGKLFLIDPIIKNLRIAKQKILNLNFNNFEIIECALSNSTGRKNFYTNIDPKSSSESDSMYDMKLIGYSNKQKKTKVQVKKLYNIMRQSKIKRIHFLKIDVEGNEFNVLKGAENYLNNGRIRFIQFEFGNAAKAARIYLHDIIFLLEPKQYKMFIIKPRGLMELKFTVFYEQRYSYINLLAVHKNSIKSISDIIIKN